MPVRKTFTVDYDFGEAVYLKTDSEIKRIVTGIILRPGGGKIYELANGVEVTWHQGVEIEKYPDVPKVRGFK